MGQVLLTALWSKVLRAFSSTLKMCEVCGNEESACRHLHGRSDSQDRQDDDWPTVFILNITEDTLRHCAYQEDSFSKLHLEEDKMPQDKGNDLTKKQQYISIQGFAIRI